MNSDTGVVVLDGARTPVGRFGGAFKDVPAHELGATAAREALVRSEVSADELDEVVMGCIGQVGPDAYIARRVSLSAGVPESIPAFSVNRLCGSGLQAIWSGSLQIRAGSADFVLAGGTESMTRMPFYDFNARQGMKLGDHRLVDGTLGMLTDPFYDIHMGITAENVAERYDVSRAEQDEFAVESQRRAATAQALAVFAEEITAVDVPGSSEPVSRDEPPRPGTTLEQLSALRTIFKKDGTVTAGNCAGMNDGGTAVVLANHAIAKERGLPGLATLEAVATGAMDPGLMGYAPVLALAKLFEQTGMSPDDIDTFEVNEAFAAQAIPVIRDAKLDPAKVNPYGGGIALGHAVGATAATLSLRVAKDLARRDLEWGVVTMCIGGGQALAALFRRTN
ncbi:thiolase family protein [Rhodococcus wratislaviensis]|uniref:thiolase family protein n=1 Tax=Rhodococcus wratislaviensis TaxID=44752 RepID=UPI00365B5F3B